MICPDCKGSKVIRGYACPGFRAVSIPCLRCKGVGIVSNDMLEWIEHGKKIKAARIARRITMREEAKVRGFKIGEYSDIELGKVNNLKEEIRK